VVLKSVVDVAHIDHISSFMTKEADELVRTNAKPFNQGVNCPSEHFSSQEDRLIASKQISFKDLL